MKKWIAWLLLAATMIGLTACGGGSSEQEMSLDGVNTIGGNTEYTLKYVYATQDVVPPNPSSFYTHYEADFGKTYMVFAMDVKNLANSQVFADEVLAVQMQMGKTSYPATITVEGDGGGDLDYANITPIDPLETARIYYMFQIPKDQAENTMLLTVKSGKQTHKAALTAAQFADRVKPLQPGQTITDDATLSAKVEAVLFSDAVYPSAPDGFYSYYEAEAGKTYLVLKLRVKNLKGTDLCCDSIAGVQVIYQDTYHYSAFGAVEESDGSDLSGYISSQEIDPLDTRSIYYLAEVPEEVENGPVSIRMYILGEYYQYDMD